MVGTLVTVTGGTGKPNISLQYKTGALAVMTAQALASAIDGTYTSATYETAANTVSGSNGGYLIVAKGALASGTINAVGFGAIVVQDDRPAIKIDGGGDPSGQVVLASGSGLTYTALTGNATVDSGGGKNNITFGSGNDAYYSTQGSSTVNALGGSDTIYAGTGKNTINLGSGSASISSTGADTINLGSGIATVSVTGSGHDKIVGASTVGGTGFSLTFIGGSQSSTITGGAGSYDITGGRGGGKFTGGSAGGNSIVGGSGSVTIIGGGAGDTLSAGTGNALIQAGLGNETLSGGAGGSGITDFQILKGISGGSGSTLVVNDFNGSRDYFTLGHGFTANYALEHTTVTGSNTYFTLQDGTTVELVNFKGLSSTNFH